MFLSSLSLFKVSYNLRMKRVFKGLFRYFSWEGVAFNFHSALVSSNYSKLWGSPMSSYCLFRRSWVCDVAFFILVPSILGETRCAVKLILKLLAMQEFAIKKEWGSRPWEGYSSTFRMDYGDLALHIDLLVPLSYQIPCHLLRKPCLQLSCAQQLVLPLIWIML